MANAGLDTPTTAAIAAATITAALFKPLPVRDFMPIYCPFVVEYKRPVDTYLLRESTDVNVFTVPAAPLELLSRRRDNSCWRVPRASYAWMSTVGGWGRGADGLPSFVAAGSVEGRDDRLSLLAIARSHVADT
ncbi:hypothetical protein GCM10010109_87250 [Actinoplanes campanulatus]|nr:hypothetical protein GCM10010109_87250 [Actinoplanes campanulatus]GID41876.1 hypothetical protein Aca09nite_83820 [Actinoplanes campanulatus]